MFMTQVKFHPKLLRGIHPEGTPLHGLFTAHTMHKDDTFYCILDVNVKKLRKKLKREVWDLFYNYGVCVNGEWMVPRNRSGRDRVFFINCSETPNVKIRFNCVTSMYARMAEVILLKDVTPKVSYTHNMLYPCSRYE